ncbi:MAG: rhomboid family intramembrane serine protease [Endomicrobia bacterium]|nr:rhomboid family intramembrane serine protease [Endomicrobiia bacterium]MCX7716702.1 rhomboid family intramembrane serine protease [Endomicrobiia bacterium]
MIPLKDNIPSYRKPIVNFFIIIINSVVFIYQYFFLPTRQEIENFIFTYGFTPFNFITYFPSVSYTILTSMFLHGSFFHFLGNMWFLYIFGDNVEDRFGHFKYLVVYLICGLTAGLLQFILNPWSKIPMIGASGAISGVLGAYFVFYPSAGVLTFIPLGLFSRVIVLPAVLFLGLWFIFQFLSGTQSLALQMVLGREIGGVAYWAHIGGFICGLLIAIFSRKKRYKTYWKYL